MAEIPASPTGTVRRMVFTETSFRNGGDDTVSTKPKQSVPICFDGEAQCVCNVTVTEHHEYIARRLHGLNTLCTCAEQKVNITAMLAATDRYMTMIQTPVSNRG